MANLVRKVLDKFSVKGNATYSSDTSQCLPIVKQVPDEDYQYVMWLTIILIVHICSRPYIRRMRRSLVAFMYPKRERERIQYLYNSMLQQRRQQFRFTLASAQMRLRSQAQSVDPGIGLLMGEMLHLLHRSLFSSSVQYKKWLRRSRQTWLRGCLPITCCVCDVKCRWLPVELSANFCSECDNAYCTRCHSYLNRLCLLCQMPSLEAEFI